MLSPSGAASVKVVLNQENLSSFEGFEKYHTSQFLYVRDNLIGSFADFPVFSTLRILDVSFNNLKRLDDFPYIETLEQLFLNGNGLNSFEGFPALPMLELFSVSHNDFQSLNCLPMLPKLGILGVAGNSLRSLEGLPLFPSLEVIRVAGNPLTKNALFMDTVVMACNYTLRRVDDTIVSKTQRHECEKYPIAVGVAARYGYMLEEDATDVTAEALALLVESEKEATADDPNALASIRFEGAVAEDETVTVICEFTPAAPHPAYRWLRAARYHAFEEIEGADKDQYTLTKNDVNKCIMVEVTAEEGSGQPVVLVSPDVTPALPAVVSISLEGNAMEGEFLTCNSEYHGGFEGHSVLKWYRNQELVQEGAVREYELKLADVGASIRLEYVPVRSDGIAGEPKEASSDTIGAAPPQMLNLVLVGECKEGAEMRVSGEHYGGHMGETSYEWFSCLPADEEFDQLVPIVPEESEENVTSEASACYPTAEEVGRKVVVKVTPRNTEGAEGTPQYVTSVGTIEAGAPIFTGHLVGDCVEENPLVVEGQYRGGKPARPVVTWYLVDPESNERVEIPQAKDDLEWTPTADEIGKRVEVEYVPVREDRMLGEMTLLSSEGVIKAAVPCMRNFRLEAEAYKEGEALQAIGRYVGGQQGTCTLQWWRAAADANLEDEASWELLPDFTNHLVYTALLPDVGCTLRATFLPKRSDGVIGERAEARSETIQACPPMVLNVGIVGLPEEGEDLVGEGDYFGGVEGASTRYWLRVAEDGMEELAAEGNKYTCELDDSGLRLVYEYTPMRNDGVVGETVRSALTAPVAQGPPRVKDLTFEVDAFVEGETATADYRYYGGMEGESLVTWYRGEDGKDTAAFKQCGFGPEYTYSYADIGHQMLITVLPVRADGDEGEMAEARSPVIKAAQPTVRNLAMSTEPYEGQECIFQGDYLGGKEGNSVFRWYLLVHGEEDQELSSEKYYIPTKADVGSRLRLEYTPVREDGVPGETLSIVTLPVHKGIPLARNVQLIKEANGTYRGSFDYNGGIPGEHEYYWQRHLEGEWIDIDSATGISYHPVRVDWHKTIRFGVVPIREDGVEGNRHWSGESEEILPSGPVIDAVIVVGEPEEGEILTATVKGYDGPVNAQWFRRKANQPPRPIRGSTKLTYQTSAEDIGFQLQCSVSPQGSENQEAGSASGTSGTIGACLPKFLDTTIKGGPNADSRFMVEARYLGGVQGKSEVKWFRATGGDGDFKQIVGVVNNSYQGSADDVDTILKVEYTPIREDRTAGTVATAQIGPLMLESSLKGTVDSSLASGKASFLITDMDGEDVNAHFEKDKFTFTHGKKKLVAEKFSVSTNIQLDPVKLNEFVLVVSDSVSHRFRASNVKVRDEICLVFRGLNRAFCTKKKTSWKPAVVAVSSFKR